MKALGFVVALVGAILSAPLLADAQQPARVPRVGFLVNTPALVEAFWQGMRELGYVEGQNISAVYRYAEAKVDRYPVLAGELVREKVDVIVTGGPQAVRALKEATSTIPIVMAAIADPVGAGFVASLARPGGNITGLSLLAPELDAKRLQLLKEALPKVSRLAVLWDPTAGDFGLKTTQAAGRAMGIQLQVLEVRAPKDIAPAFEAAKQGRAGAMNVLASPILYAHRDQLVKLAAKHRIPAMYQWRDFVEAGGLMSYGPDIRDMYRRAAAYVDKILKGAKSGDLPVEQASRYELAINLKTAKALGLAFPQSVLLRVDRVVQ